MVKAPSGNSATTPNFNIFVTFATDNGREFIQNIPLQELTGLASYGFTSSQSSTFNGTFNIAPRIIIFPKSYIQIPVSNPFATIFSYVFGFYYRP